MTNRSTLALATMLTMTLGFGCANTSNDASAPPAGDAAADAPASADAAAPGTIVDVAVAAGSFTTLAKALEAAGLVETLQGEGPFTVFAPTDEAFAKLPAGALDGLLANPEQLKAVLLLHVVSGKVMAADVGGMSEATAVSGGKLAIDTSNGVTVGGATVTATDIQASNGVIHVIDTVILPK